MIIGYHHLTDARNHDDKMKERRANVMKHIWKKMKTNTFHQDEMKRTIRIQSKFMLGDYETVVREKSNQLLRKYNFKSN